MKSSSDINALPEESDEQKKLKEKVSLYHRAFIVEKVKAELYGYSTHEAYIAAGGKGKTKYTAYTQMSRILKDPDCRAYYDSLKEEFERAREEDLVMSQREATEFLTRIGRTKITDLIDFKTVEVGEDEDGNPVHQSVWAMKNADEIDELALSAISEVSAGKNGLTFKIHSQMDAVQKLSKIKGWEAAQKIEHSGGVVDMTIKADDDPQKASETYMDVMRGISEKT